MDDTELEARLRTRLHRRFDDAPIPANLVANVRQALATEARPLGFATRVGRVRLGWVAVAAAVVIALAAIGIGKGLGPTGPGANATPTPSATTASGRWFVVLPPAGTELNKPVAGRAGDVMSARIRALGIGNFTAGGGYGIQFLLPADGPSDASIRAVLGATGDVRIVPLPDGDYGVGKLTATLGEALPKDEPALIGWDGIASVSSDPLASTPDVTITLKPAAAQAFGDYTAAHLGETFSIVLDGRVVLLPMVMDPITNGQITITPGSSDAFAETAAILAGGELPEGWRGASVPVLISRDKAVTTALLASQGGTVQDASLSVDLVNPDAGTALQVVWNVAVFQPQCPDNMSCVSSDLLVAVDAVTGILLHIEAQEL